MRNNNQKRRNAIIAAALGAALLMGGGTFAVWTASAGLTDATTIRTGELSISPIPEQDPHVYDMSPDSFLQNAPYNKSLVTVYGTGAGQVQGYEFTNSVMVDGFYAVPGDKLAFKHGYEMTIMGQNLKANLMLDVSGLFDDTDGPPLLDPAEWTVSYMLADGSDFVGVPNDVSSSTAKAGPILLSPTPLTQDSDPKTVGIIVFLEFKSSAESPEGMMQEIDLTAASDLLSVILQQVRA